MVPLSKKINQPTPPRNNKQTAPTLIDRLLKIIYSFRDALLFDGRRNLLDLPSEPMTLGRKNNLQSHHPEVNPHPPSQKQEALSQGKVQDHLSFYDGRKFVNEEIAEEQRRRAWNVTGFRMVKGIEYLCEGCRREYVVVKNDGEPPMCERCCGRG